MALHYKVFKVGLTIAWNPSYLCSIRWRSPIQYSRTWCEIPSYWRSSVPSSQSCWNLWGYPSTVKEDENDNAYKRIGLENDVIWGVRIRLTQIHVKIVVLVESYAAHGSVYVSAVSANKGRGPVAQWGTYCHAPHALRGPFDISCNRRCCICEWEERALTFILFQLLFEPISAFHRVDVEVVEARVLVALTSIFSWVDIVK